MPNSKTNEENIQIQVGERTLSAIKTTPEAKAGVTFVYAPGAGSNINDPFGNYLSPRLATAGIATLRFQFPYMEAGSRRPDRPALLEETWLAAIDVAGTESEKLVIGGRSMGGRIASQVAARGNQIDGLVLFAYPLNPPYNRAISRDGHLADIDVPTLFCSGTRDNFASPEDLRTAADKMPSATVHQLDGADHGFNVLKSSGQSREDVWAEAVNVMLEWLKGLS